MYYISAGLTFLWWAFPSSDNDEEENGEDGDADIKCLGLLFGWFSSTISQRMTRSSQVLL